jgi:hypothetical protein
MVQLLMGQTEEFRRGIASRAQAHCRQIFLTRTYVLYYVILLTGARLVELKFVSSRHEVEQLDFMKFASSDTNKLFP